MSKKTITQEGYNPKKHQIKDGKLRLEEDGPPNSITDHDGIRLNNLIRTPIDILGS